MTFAQYQEAAMRTAIYPPGLAYPMAGLAEECGEANGQWAKCLRDDGGMMTEARRLAIIKELGDVLWEIAACAHEVGATLDTVAQGNLDKLADRQARGVLKGSGDER